jgi:hypothetical protein
MFVNSFIDRVGRGDTMPVAVKTFRLEPKYNANFRMQEDGGLHIECKVGEEEALFAHLERHVSYFRSLEKQASARKANPGVIPAAFHADAFRGVDPAKVKTENVEGTQFSYVLADDPQKLVEPITVAEGHSVPTETPELVQRGNSDDSHLSPHIPFLSNQ